MDANYSFEVLKGECKIDDIESGSKAVFPIIVDQDYRVKVCRIDTQNKSQTAGKACDFFIMCEKKGCKVSCLTELKGTQHEKLVSDAMNQLLSSMENMKVSYMEGSDFALGIIVGAPDKTLPKMISPNSRKVCKKLLVLCNKKKKISNMDNLLITIQPDKTIKKAMIWKKNPPVIKCHSQRGAHVPVPSMLIEAVTM